MLRLVGWRLRAAVVPGVHARALSALAFETPGPIASSLRWVDSAPRKPDEGEVRVKVLAAPIHALDVAAVHGFSTTNGGPRIAGSEAVGEVVEVGAGVSGFKPGDRVASVAPFAGTWQSSVTVPASVVHPVPSSIDASTAAATHSLVPSAIALLSFYAKVEKGHTILLTAPTTPLGQCVIQVAKQRGVNTIAVIDNADKATEQQLQALGATSVVPLATASSGAFLRDTAAKHAPAMLVNGKCGNVAATLSRCLKPGGVVVTFGGELEGVLSVPPSSMVERDLTWLGFDFGAFLRNAPPEVAADLFKTAHKLVQDKAVVVPAKTHKFGADSFQAALAESLKSPSTQAVFVM